MDINALTIGSQSELDGIARASASLDSLSLHQTLALASCVRSRELLDAFFKSVALRHLFAAGPMVRIQLDSVLRLMAARIVDDANDFVKFSLGRQ